jgi:hypothetical protein
MTDKEKQDILKSKIYRFKVDLNNDNAYRATAFVESPAIQKNFQYFRELSTSENGEFEFNIELEKNFMANARLGDSINKLMRY